MSTHGSGEYADADYAARDLAARDSAARGFTGGDVAGGGFAAGEPGPSSRIPRQPSSPAPLYGSGSYGGSSPYGASASAPPYPQPGPGAQSGTGTHPGPGVQPGAGVQPGSGGYDAVPGPGAEAGPHRRVTTWPGTLALVLVVVLLVGVGLQTWQLYRLDSRLTEANNELAQQQAYERERLDALEGRTGELEQFAGEAFNPEAIAEAVLPSVFRVRAGNSGGTAFAVGGATEDGGTNLFTNYHVVQEVWEQGVREVSLERTNQRYRAEIMDVDPGEDVAWLRTDSQFTGLSVATEPARSGQQIVAVGAPFGLTDTVTVGVVSAADRDIQGAPGRWIQFDAPINPGNSGGPVINAAQEVVGIATAGRLEAEGIGLARPIDVACELFEVC